MIIWKEQYVLGHGQNRSAIITIAFHDETEPVSFDEWVPAYLSSFKVEPLTPEFRLTERDKWMRSVMESHFRNGWRWVPAPELGQGAYRLRKTRSTE